MIDEGQTDWKVVSIDIEDPLAPKFSDISDVDVYMPKLLPSTVEWLRNYKMADGKPANTFAFNARSKTKNFTLNVLRETHQQWCSLLASKKEMGFCRTHTLQTNSVSKKNIIDQEAARLGITYRKCNLRKYIVFNCIYRKVFNSKSRNFFRIFQVAFHRGTQHRNVHLRAT